MSSTFERMKRRKSVSQEEELRLLLIEIGRNVGCDMPTKETGRVDDTDKDRAKQLLDIE